MLYLAMVLAALVPVAVAYVVRWWLGRDHLQPLLTYPLLVFAGGAGGIVFGLFFSPSVQSWFGKLAAEQGDSLVMSVLAVPLAEETGKALILLLFLLTPWYRSAVDGMLYGFAAGAGFAAFENLFFFASADALGVPGGWATLAAVRLIPSTLIHGGATAIVGAYLGAARWDRRPLVVFASLPAALLMATLVHGGWNGLMELASSEHGVVHALMGWGLLALLSGGLLLVLRSAHLREKRALRAELEPIVRQGFLTPFDLEAVLDRRARRASVRAALQRAAVGLAFALRGQRIEGQGGKRVVRLRALLARLSPTSGRLSIEL